ncbi:hypothetical protein TWF788_006711 [Orbilia oligospora]|uniref:Uncharacterized protein n=1 Tax=Orbilia oligospora TaxID=2813651 RepID=A0A7C8TW84_ORBOL|nr:hypothetical protein TWF788_006711 [Orbilia oligospora]
MSTLNNGFGPDIDIPIDTAPRIAELRLMLEDPATNPGQLPNIRAVLAEYEAGRTPSFLYQNGHPICIADLDFNKPSWVEGGNMLVNSCAYQNPQARMTTQAQTS